MDNNMPFIVGEESCNNNYISNGGGWSTDDRKQHKTIEDHQSTLFALNVAHENNLSVVHYNDLWSKLSVPIG